jgi:hypothetical protein
MLRLGCCIFAAAAMSSSVAAGAADADSGLRAAQVTLAGVAGVTPGMTPLQVQGVWEIPIVLTGPIGSPCRMARVVAGPVRGYALFQHGRLGALFFTAGVKTDRGIEVGSTSKAIIKAYGSSRLLFWPSPDSSGIDVYTRKRYPGDGRALRFDLDPQTHRVTQIGLGGRELSRTSGRY